jgi:tetratricopeptide (TPR) repeat protein
VAAIRALMGAVQLTLELATAVSAWGLAQSLRSYPASKSAEAGESRRGLYGRLAIYVSLAFLVLNVRQPVWSTYLAVLNQSNLLRQFVLKNDVKTSSSHRSGLFAPPGPRPEGDFEMLLSSAYRLAASNQVSEAKKVYLRIITMAESIGHAPDNGGTGKHQQALALNNLAWMLATCEDVHLREPEQALSYARKAVELAGDEGMYWNTLGVAYFRVQDWDEATKALGRSMELRSDGKGDSYDWFFLAMIHARKDQKEEGRQWYDRAVAWFHNARQGNRELYRFQVEAAAALGIPRHPVPMVTTQPQAW